MCNYKQKMNTNQFNGTVLPHPPWNGFICKNYQLVLLRLVLDKLYSLLNIRHKHSVSHYPDTNNEIRKMLRREKKGIKIENDRVRLLDSSRLSHQLYSRISSAFSFSQYRILSTVYQHPPKDVPEMVPWQREHHLVESEI